MPIPISPALINDATYLWRRRASKRLLVLVFIQKQKTLRTPICQDTLAGWFEPVWFRPAFWRASWPVLMSEHLPLFLSDL
ncbi:hypothetical protein [Roseovarius sp. ZX-A-9]|uniref:hypothetical protein n=1 Tax=Roseovarius sp. ZX-A-9 TaxID=3014783 RepID=UPI00232BEAC5|nr:hypothetical protein [Roseovarius sp. ZX-A-9]